MPQGGSARCQLWTSENGVWVKSDGKQAQLSHPPSQTGLHHLSQCCLGCLDQGLSYPVQLSYTVPPFKILERYWLEGRLRRPSSSDLGMHLLSNLARSLLAMATKSTKLTPTGVRHWPASTLASPTAHREHPQIYLRVNSLLAITKGI